MTELSRAPGAFIRPSPGGATMGGVARRTRETILLCEAAGFDTVIVETVGAGQSETTVAEMTDMFVLILPPAAGDELQGLKRGIIELADLVLINKADGELLDHANRAAADYANALHLIRPRCAGWEVPVRAVSALTGAGVDAVWDDVARFRAVLEASGDWRAAAPNRPAPRCGPRSAMASWRNSAPRPQSPRRSATSSARSWKAPARRRMGRGIAGLFPHK
jgi:LAO/AO transport system kinase